jgi:hypothetical protein
MKTAIHVYSFLLSLYPHKYQQAFRAQMLQTFIDQYQDIEKSGGGVSTGFWCSTIADEVQNIARQHTILLTNKNPFLKVTIGKLLLSMLLVIPVYPIFYVLLVKTSLALPHPHLSGIGVLIALALLLVVPGVGSLVTSCVLASAMVSLSQNAKRTMLRLP